MQETQLSIIVRFIPFAILFVVFVSAMYVRFRNLDPVKRRRRDLYWLALSLPYAIPGALVASAMSGRLSWTVVICAWLGVFGFTVLAHWYFKNKWADIFF